MWNGFEGMGWGWIGLGMAHMLLFWVLVIVGIVALARSFGNSPAPGRGSLDILNERYARGELTRDQFEQMKRDLNT